jgi:hypothetical protein
MSRYVQKPDGKFAGSISTAGRDSVPAPASASHTPPAAPAAPLQLAGVAERLRPAAPEGQQGHDPALLASLGELASAVEDLADRRARLQGHAPVGKWELEGDEALAWSSGYAAGMGAVLLAVGSRLPPGQRAAVAATAAAEELEACERETLEHFRDRYDDAGGDLDAMSAGGESWDSPLDLDELVPDEQARIIVALKQLPAGAADTLRALLADPGRLGTFEDAVATALAP